MAIIAITTSSSISVKAGLREHVSESVKRDDRVAEFITSYPNAGGEYGIPCSSATALQVTFPFITLMPPAKAGCW